MTNLDSILKSRDITLLTKAHLVKAMVFPVVRYGCESWTIKKAECRRRDAFELWFWRRLLRVLWTARRSNLSILKEINSEYSLEELMLKLSWSSNTLATWCKESTYQKRSWCWERFCLPVQEIQQTYLIQGSERFPWRRKWQPILVFLPWKSYGQRRPVGYSPWSHRRVGHHLATKQQKIWLTMYEVLVSGV